MAGDPRLRGGNANRAIFSITLVIFSLTFMASVSHAGFYVNDFNAGPISEDIRGNGDEWRPKFEDRVLKLTTSEQSQQGWVVLPRLEETGLITAFRATFKLLIHGGSTPPADGFSFNITFDPPPSDQDFFAEEGVASGLSVTFDTYVNGDLGEVSPEITIKFNGEAVDGGRFPLLAQDIQTGPIFEEVEIELTPDRKLSLKFKGVSYAVLLPADLPVGGQIVLGARTGFYTDNHWIDDLRIVTHTDGPHVTLFEPTGAGVSPAAGLRVQIEDPHSEVVRETISLTVDGAAVAPSPQFTGAGWDISYRPDQPWTLNSFHDVRLSFASEVSQQDQSWRFQVTALSDNYPADPLPSNTGFTAVGSTAEFSHQLGEPDHAGKPGLRSAWLAWRPAQTGVATLTTEGSNFDTLLAVYVGDTFGLLRTISSDDDSGPSRTSVVKFNADPQVIYHFAVDGFRGDSGQAVINLRLQPGPLSLSRFQLDKSPSSPSVVPGAPVLLTLRVLEESPIPSTHEYRWFFNRELLNVSGTSYFIPSITPADLGGYVVEVTSRGDGFTNVLYVGPAILQINTAGETNVAAVPKYGDVPAGGGVSTPALQSRRLMSPSTGNAAAARGFTGAQIFSTRCVDLREEPCADALQGMYLDYETLTDGALTIVSSADFEHHLQVFTNLAANIHDPEEATYLNGTPTPPQGTGIRVELYMGYGRTNTAYVLGNPGTVHLNYDLMPFAFVGTDAQTRGDWLRDYGHTSNYVARSGMDFSSLVVGDGALSPYTWQIDPPDVRAAVLSPGGDRVAGCWYTHQSMTFSLDLPEDTPTRVSLYCLDWDRLGRDQQVTVRRVADNRVLNTQRLRDFGDGEYLIWDLQGDVQIEVANLASPAINAVVSGIFLDPVPYPAARFIGTEAITRGNWPGRYGQIIQHVAASGADSSGLVLDDGPLSPFTWALNPPDVRAPVLGMGGNRVAGCWYSSQTMTIPLDLPEDTRTRVSLYCLDWDRLGRDQQVTVRRVADDQVLNTQRLRDFGDGEYLIWDIQGDVRIEVGNLGGQTVNAVVSGIFVDPAPSNTAPFVGVDAQTRGNWFGHYGQTAWHVAASGADSSDLVLDDGLLSPFPWAINPPDVRAPVLGMGASRVAGCWYTHQSMTIPLDLPEDAPVRVSLYCLDWDRLGRDQQVTVLRTVDNSILSVYHLTDFGDGEYLIWDLQGDVRIVVTNLARPELNATVSGIFLENLRSPITVPPSLAATTDSGIHSIEHTVTAAGPAIPIETDGSNRPAFHSAVFDRLGGLRLFILGSPGDVSVLETSTDLIHWEHWEVIAADQSGLTDVLVPADTTSAARFYRVVPK